MLALQSQSPWLILSTALSLAWWHIALSHFLIPGVYMLQFERDWPSKANVCMLSPHLVTCLRRIRRCSLVRRNVSLGVGFVSKAHARPSGFLPAAYESESGCKALSCCSKSMPACMPPTNAHQDQFMKKKEVRKRLLMHYSQAGERMGQDISCVSPVCVISS